MKKEVILDRIIEISFYLLFALVPLILTPFNFELFEFNKMMLTYFLTIIITSAWIIKVILKGKVEIKKSPLDPFILLFFLSSLLSTIFSLNIHTSLWGYYSRFHGGLLSTISYILLYYGFLTNMDKKKVFYTIYITLGSSFLVTFYAVLEKLGIDAKYWVQDVQNRVFSTLGQPNWLGAFITSLIYIPLSLFFKTNQQKQKIVYLGISLTFFLALIFTNSKSALLAFWIGAVIFSLLLIKIEKKLWQPLGIIFSISLALYLVLGGKTYQYLKKAPLWLDIFNQKQQISLPSPQPQKNQYVPYISESSDIRKVVWKGAVKIFFNYPILGSGVETFAYSYYQSRPIEHNLLSEWDFLYNKAHNEFLNILANQGLMGILTYLGLISSFLVWSIKKLSDKKTENKKLLIALLSGYITILITNFFGFSVVMVAIFFFLFPAFSFLLTKPDIKNQVAVNLNKQGQNQEKNLFFKDALIAITVITSLLLLNTIIKKWRADFHYARGKNYSEAGYLVAGIQDLQKALELSGSEPVFHSQMAETAARTAVAYQQSREASQAAEIIKELEQTSIKETNQALNLNPFNLSLYKSQAKVYIYLSYLDPGYTKEAITALEQAIKLAPTDAKTFYNLALLYKEANNLSKAQETLEKTVELKPNYLKAWLDLAGIYKQAGQNQQAKNALNFILEKLDPGNKQAQKMLEETK